MHLWQAVPLISCWSRPSSLWSWPRIPQVPWANYWSPCRTCHSCTRRRTVGRPKQSTSTPGALALPRDGWYPFRFENHHGKSVFKSIMALGYMLVFGRNMWPLLLRRVNITGHHFQVKTVSYSGVWPNDPSLGFRQTRGIQDSWRTEPCLGEVMIVLIMDFVLYGQLFVSFAQHAGHTFANVATCNFRTPNDAAPGADIGVGAVGHEEIREVGPCQAQIGGRFQSPILWKLHSTFAKDLQRCSTEAGWLETRSIDDDICWNSFFIWSKDLVFSDLFGSTIDQSHVLFQHHGAPVVVHQHASANGRILWHHLLHEIRAKIHLPLDVIRQLLDFSFPKHLESAFWIWPRPATSNKWYIIWVKLWYFTKTPSKSLK